MYDKSTWDVVGWREFELSLPEEFRTEDVLEQLHYWYHSEIEQLTRDVTLLVRDDKPYYAYFGRIDPNMDGSQMIAHFSVKDLSKQDDPQQVNWHLQNTSQWVYAGGLVVDKYAISRGDKRVVSTHH